MYFLFVVTISLTSMYLYVFKSTYMCILCQPINILSLHYDTSILESVCIICIIFRIYLVKNYFYNK